MKNKILYISLLILILTCFDSVEVSWASDIRSKPTPLTAYRVVEIGKVVSAPEAWNLRQVRLKGIVTALRIIPRGGGMVPRQVQGAFTLQDKTGQIEIFYTETRDSLGPIDTQLLFNGSSLDALVTIVYMTPMGSETGTVTGRLMEARRSVH